ncbi:MAG: hypothetical protein EOO41_00535 [Methanobacteriota archaeon]|nr:MAG: hypothetical protein EOO41_00535 [Euryarchaeota archaeon]
MAASAQAHVSASLAAKLTNRGADVSTLACYAAAVGSLEGVAAASCCPSTAPAGDASLLQEAYLSAAGSNCVIALRHRASTIEGAAKALSVLLPSVVRTPAAAAAGVATGGKPDVAAKPSKLPAAGLPVKLKTPTPRPSAVVSGARMQPPSVVKQTAPAARGSTASRSDAREATPINPATTPTPAPSHEPAHNVPVAQAGASASSNVRVAVVEGATPVVLPAAQVTPAASSGGELASPPSAGTLSVAQQMGDSTTHVSVDPAWWQQLVQMPGMQTSDQPPASTRALAGHSVLQTPVHPSLCFELDEDEAATDMSFDMRSAGANVSVNARRADGDTAALSVTQLDTNVYHALHSSLPAYDDVAFPAPSNGMLGGFVPPTSAVFQHPAQPTFTGFGGFPMSSADAVVGRAAFDAIPAPAPADMRYRFDAHAAQTAPLYSSYGYMPLPSAAPSASTLPHMMFGQQQVPMSMTMPPTTTGVYTGYPLMHSIVSEPFATVSAPAYQNAGPPQPAVHANAPAPSELPASSRLSQWIST